MTDRTAASPRRRLVMKPPPETKKTPSQPAEERFPLKLASDDPLDIALANEPESHIDGLPTAPRLLEVWLGQWERVPVALGTAHVEYGHERLHRQGEIPTLPHPLEQRGRFRKPVTDDPLFAGVTRNGYLREPKKLAELMSFEWAQLLIAKLAAKVERQRRIAFTAWRKLFDAEGGKGRVQAFIAWRSQQELIEKMGFTAVNTAGMRKVEAVPVYTNLPADLEAIAVNLSLAEHFEERLRQHPALAGCAPGFMLPGKLRKRLEATRAQIRSDLGEIAAGFEPLSDVREWARLLDWKPEGDLDEEKLELDFQRLTFECWETVLPEEYRRHEQQRLKARLKRCKLGILEPENPRVCITDTWAAECSDYAIDFQIRSLTRALGQAETRVHSNHPKGSARQRMAKAQAMVKAEDEAQEIRKKLAFLKELKAEGGRWYA